MEPDPSILPLWVRYVIGIGFMLTLAVGAFLIHERRRQGLERLAEKLGLTYREFASPGLALPATSVLMTQEFWRGEGTLRQILEGEIDGFEIMLFEHWRIDDVNTGRTRGYPVIGAVVTIPGKPLPDFLLRPERWRDRIMDRGADIDFPDTPGFSRRCLLQGEDEARVRAVFTINVRDFFERCPRRIAEGIGGQLCYHRPSRLLRHVGFRPRPVQALLGEVLTLARHLRDAA